MPPMTFSKWFKAKDGNTISIRRKVRHEDGRKTQERLPVARFQQYLNNVEELDKFIDRLNGRDRQAERAKQAYKELAAFCDIRLVDRFSEHLLSEVPTPKEARQLLSALKRHVLQYFVVEAHVPDPLEWKKHESHWGEWLRKTRKPGRGTLRRIVQVANRYLEFLHNQYPAEYPLHELEPISLAKQKLMYADVVEVGAFIEPADWRIIVKNAGDLLPAITLAYNYGLRRAEVLALQPHDVRKGHLFLERQQVSVGTTGPLKSREKRKVPHWYMTAAQAHAQILNVVVMHPDTFTERWGALMTKLEMTYFLHDLRRTFITRALREQNHVDVQHAAGHASIDTTMSYQRDDRDLDDEPFIA